MNQRTSPVPVESVSSLTAGAWHHGQGGGVASSSSFLFMNEIPRRDVPARFAAAVDQRRLAGLSDDAQAVAGAFRAALRCRRRGGRFLDAGVKSTEREIARGAAVIQRRRRGERPCSVTSTLGANERIRLRHDQLNYNIHAYYRPVNTSLFVRCTLCRVQFRYKTSENCPLPLRRLPHDGDS